MIFIRATSLINSERITASLSYMQCLNVLITASLSYMQCLNVLITASLSYMQCLNVLNYFRSVERTLTINEEGMTGDGSHGDQKSSRTKGGLDHRLLFNTPADYM